MNTAASNSRPLHSSARRSALIGIGGFLAGATFGVGAQPASGKLHRLFVGFPPGGSTDVIARIIADALRNQIDGPVVVENRPGAAGRLAVETLKSTKETDGSTMFITPDVTLTIYPHIYRKLGYDAQRDMLPVAQVASFPLWIAVGPAVPASVKNIQDYLRWVQADPSRNSYASPGAGTANHFVGAMLANASGVNLTHAAYKGDSVALQDLLGGHIPMSINNPAALVPHLEGGRLRLLASTGGKRSAIAPALPTLAESGFASIKTANWFGIYVSPRTEPAAVKHLEKALAQAIRVPAVAEALMKQGLTPDFVPGTELPKRIAQESAMWADVVKSTGFSIDE